MAVKYMIVEPNKRISNDLKKILDDYEILDFKGSFTTFKEAENCIRCEPPDVVFIRVGTVELNAFQLSCVVRGLNLFSKVVFFSNQPEYAVDAFAWEAYGFLVLPFDRRKIENLLERWIERDGINMENK